ncbi:MAG: NAD-binding protein [Halobacteriales archaeon]
MTKDLRVIIVGGGLVGYHTAELLDNRGHDTVIVEQDKDRCQFLSDQYVASVIDGDGTRPSVLRQAQPERSDVIASMIGDRAGTNIGICMTAQRLAPDIHTVARIDHGEEGEYEEMVDAIVYPEELAAHTAANEIIQVSDGGVRTIEEFSEHLELLDITVTEEAPAANKPLSEVRFPRGSQIIQREGQREMAHGETVLEPEAQFLVATTSEASSELIQLLRG